MPILNRKETNKVIERLILSNIKKLEGKDKEDFKTLNKYCLLSSGNYLPVFVNIPVTQESRTGIIDLVDEGGKISKTLQKFMEDGWKEAKENFEIDLDIDKDR